jgi:hypothetical protein
MAPPDPPTDLGTSLLDGVADSIAHTASMLQSGLSGNYGIRDAFLDVMKCSIRASKLGVDVLEALGVLPPPAPPSPNPTVVTIDVPVDPAHVGSFTAAPVQAGALRAIGYGQSFQIPPGQVSVSAPTLRANGLTMVSVTVSFAGIDNEARKHTLVYEGSIMAGPPGIGHPYIVRVPKPRG